MPVYINNRSILAEIATSKKSYTSLADDSAWLYDAIVDDLKTVDGVEGMVVRLMTDAHVPMLLRRDSRGVTQRRHWLNFPAFSHVRFEGGQWVEVARSHWEGPITTGRFNIHHGKITDALVRIWMTMVQKIAQKGNWRGYSFRDEMEARALMDLSQNGLKFNEARGVNAFAYSSQLIGNSFITTLIREKRHISLRNDLLAATQGFKATHSVMAQADIERYRARKD